MSDKDLISKQVKILRCHAAVKWSKSKQCHWETGKLGNWEGWICDETEPEELPELVQLKCTASDRRLQGDRCVLLSVCRRTFFLAENRTFVIIMLLAGAARETRTARR